jgi:Trichohyalin-plectin-homology domain
MSRPRRVSSQAIERNIRAQRALDTQRRELNAFASENAKLSSVANAQSKIEVRRREAQQQACKNEELYEERIRQEADRRKMVERTKAQNEALTEELEKELREEERKKLEIQRICDEAPELRELERVLKIAYLNKERATQYEEKLLLAARERERIQAIEEQMELDRLRAVASEGDKAGAQKAKFAEQREILERQIREKEDQLEEARRQTERDKLMVDEIVRKINDEDESDYRKKRERQEATARMVREFEEQRKREVAAARAAAKAEEERIMAYNRALDARLEGVAAKKQAERDEADRILQKIIEETARKKAEEEEFNQLRDMLWEEELEAKRAAEQRARADKQATMKREMMEANAHMLQAKAEMRRRDMENEAIMVAMMKKKFAEDEAKERAEEEARRQAKLHHKVLIEKQRSEMRGMFDDERERERQLAEEAAAREEHRKRIVQEARKRLLEQHAAKLKGFLPGTAFKDADEYRSFYGDQSQDMGGSQSMSMTRFK